jgi:multicomponent Na+:H+ antiporter subunit G
MIAQVIADVLLALAVLIVAVSSIGVLVMSDVYDKVHLVTPAALVAPMLIALAITVRQGYDENSVQTWLALVFLVIAGPLLAHATLRAAQIRQTGDWRPGRIGAGSPEEDEAAQGEAAQGEAAEGEESPQ